MVDSFKDQMLDHVSTVFLNEDHFAEEMVWTPASGPEVTVLVVPHQEQTDPFYGQNEKSDVRTIKVNVATADIAAVAIHADKATLHGSTWIAIRDEPLQHGMRTITLQFDKVVKIQADDRERIRS